MVEIIVVHDMTKNVVVRDWKECFHENSFAYVSR